MPIAIYDNLNLLGLVEGGERIYLTNNTIISPIGIAEGLFTKIQDRMICTDYLVIEYAGT